ncbi:hypothetical protein ACH5RR_041754 [Cinchona calisaya]|uniref:NIN-like protein n=1 Tax=Cinchona calisaya TaxID=153742 RepID=A0ABD2XZP7_9GENT
MDAGNGLRIEFCEIDADLPKLPELQNHEIDKGGYDETCSLDRDIRTYMPNFTFEKGEHLTVFKKSKHSASKSSKLEVLILTPPNYSRRASLKDEVGDDIAGLLERVKFGSNSILLQFWKATVKLGGLTVLETAGQPFALGHFYKGLWRYRRRCHDHSYDVFYTFDKKGSRLGPPSRVFKNRIPEFCPNIEAYSTDEFPLRDFAVHECGIQGYWALPLFLRDKMQCVVGVLEVVAFKYTDIFVEHQVNPVIQALNKGGLCYYSLEDCCSSVRKDALCAQVDIQQVLEFVREVHQLPLIQAWVPCLCDDHQKQVPYVGLSSVGAWRPAELFCEMRSCDRNVKYALDFVQFKCKYGTFSVEKGNGLIGKAYSLKKPCFCRDTSQLSISDCPFVHLTRIAGFTACFAIPLQFIHPLLDALLLEIYLPPEQHYSAEEPLAMLKSLLFTVTHGFSRLNVAFGLKEGEEFCVKFSQSYGNFSFFDICRQSVGHLNRHEVLENEREELQLQSSHPVLVPMVETNATNVRKRNSSAATRSKTRDGVKTSEGVYTNGEVQITLDVLRQYCGRKLAGVAESLKVGRSTLKRICRDFGIKRWPSHKRKKDSHIHSSLRLPTASVEEVIQEPDKECYQNISAVEKEVTVSVPTSEVKIDKYNSMIVKATCGEDKVVFPLHSNSIEYLSHKIAKKFKLEVESFTIKYEDEDGDCIMIPCDEDLHFRIETLKSLGRSKINLSVVSITL